MKTSKDFCKWMEYRIDPEKVRDIPAVFGNGRCNKRFVDPCGDGDKVNDIVNGLIW